MRATTVLRTVSRLIDQHTIVRDFAVDTDRNSIVLMVEPATLIPFCSSCGCRVEKVYDARERTWRHTDLGEMKVLLKYRIRRVDCARCGPTTEMAPWAPHCSWFTYDFEELVAYHAQTTDRTRVALEMRTSWETVGDIVARVMDRLRPGDHLDGLRRIGIDELSYRKHHEYITVVVDHDTQRVVWAAPGKSADTLRLFFDALGPERASQLELVSIDMSAAFIKAVEECAPKATIVFDRFHVQRLAHDALDEVRRELTRAIRGTPEAEALKGTRFTLHKAEWNMTQADNEKMAIVMKTNEPLYRAHMLKATLVHILDGDSAPQARRALINWSAWAQRSRLAPFVRVGKTMLKYIDGIVSYVRTGLTNARTEGMNGKIRVLTRRAFGFHNAGNLIAFIFLCCSGLTIARRHE